MNDLPVFVPSIEMLAALARQNTEAARRLFLEAARHPDLSGLLRQAVGGDPPVSPPHVPAGQAGSAPGKTAQASSPRRVYLARLRQAVIQVRRQDAALNRAIEAEEKRARWWPLKAGLTTAAVFSLACLFFGRTREQGGAS